MQLLNQKPLLALNCKVHARGYHNQHKHKYLHTGKISGTINDLVQIIHGCDCITLPITKGISFDSILFLQQMCS
jgi:phosphoribosyl-AMP cyclohydrolase